MATLRLDLGRFDTVGPVPFGVRQIVPITGGQVAGERLAGTVRAGGADWVLMAPDGYGRIDARVTIETSDGVLIAVRYMGLLELSERAMQALTAGPPTEFGEITSLSYPRFETADARYSWLNTTFCVAEGRILPAPAIEYALYEVHPSTK